MFAGLSWEAFLAALAAVCHVAHQVNTLVFAGGLAGLTVSLSLGIGTLGVGTLGVGTLGVDTIGVGALGVGALGVGTLGVGALGIDALGVGALGVGTLGVGTLFVQLLRGLFGKSFGFGEFFREVF